MEKGKNKMDDIKEIKSRELPVVIFGAGIVGEVLLQACYNKGIKVEAFYDNNLNKTKSLKCGVEVIHTSKLKDRYQDASFLISAADIKDVVDQLNEMGFSKWYTSNSLLKDFDAHKHQFSAPNNFVEYAIDTCILCHNS
jgi:glutamyl-tRNA reductase